MADHFHYSWPNLVAETCGRGACSTYHVHEPKNEERSRVSVCLSRSNPVMTLARFQFIFLILLNKVNIV